LLFELDKIAFEAFALRLDIFNEFAQSEPAAA
jgi:hypothetical protein